MRFALLLAASTALAQVPAGVYITTTASDDAGNIYLAGITSMPGLPTTPGAIQSTYAAGMALDPAGDLWTAGIIPPRVVLSKISPSGELTPMGAFDGMSTVSGLAVDPAGRPSVVGTYRGKVIAASFDAGGHSLRSVSF